MDRSQSQKYLDRLFAVECPDATFHPGAGYPLVLAKGQGSLVYDVEGKRYIDFCASFGSLALGHNNAELISAVFEYLNQQGLSQGMVDIYSSRDKIELLESLLCAYPMKDGKATLTVTGGQAVEVALKTAMLAKKCSGFISFREGYHGLDLGALKVTHREDFRLPFSDYFGEQGASFLQFNCSQGELEAAIDKLQESGAGCAAVLLEPIQGRAGVVLARSGWLEMVAAVCRQRGVLLIFDEILTGLGRTGSMGIGLDIKPDLVCLGKALGGGMPISACIGRGSVMQAWPECRSEALHTGTYFGHPFTCAVARSCLSIIDSQNLASRALRLGKEIVRRLSSDLQDVSTVREIRGQGFMLAIELRDPGSGVAVMHHAAKLGLIVIPSGKSGNCVALTPALNITEEVLWDGLDILVKVIRSHHS